MREVINANIPSFDNLFVSTIELTDIVRLQKICNVINNNDPYAILVRVTEENEETSEITITEIQESIVGNEEDYARLLLENASFVYVMGEILKRSTSLNANLENYNQEAFNSEALGYKYTSTIMAFLMNFPDLHRRAKNFAPMISGFLPYALWAFELYLERKLKENSYILTEDVENEILTMVITKSSKGRSDMSSVLYYKSIKDIIFKMTKIFPENSLLYYDMISEMNVSDIFVPPAKMDKNQILLNKQRWNSIRVRCTRISNPSDMVILGETLDVNTDIITNFMK